MDRTRDFMWTQERGDVGAGAEEHEPLPRANPQALQRAGSSLVERMLSTPAFNEAAHEAPAAELDLCVDTESVDRTSTTPEELQEGQVGHTFLRYRPQVGAPAPYTVEKQLGFWPAKVPSRLGRPVQGYVRDPDEAHQAKGVYRYRLSAPQVKSLFAYVDAHRLAPYNIYLYNCSTFAMEAVQAAGQKPPSECYANAVCFPTKIYKGILQKKKAKDPSASTTPLGKVLRWDGTVSNDVDETEG